MEPISDAVKDALRDGAAPVEGFNFVQKLEPITEEELREYEELTRSRFLSPQATRQITDTIVPRLIAEVRRLREGFLEMPTFLPPDFTTPSP